MNEKKLFINGVVKYFVERMCWTIYAFLIVTLFIFAIHKMVDFPHVRMLVTMSDNLSQTKAVTVVFEIMMGTITVEEYDKEFPFFTENDFWVAEQGMEEELKKSLVRRETKLLMPWQRKHIRMYINKLLEQGENRNLWYNIDSNKPSDVAAIINGKRFWSKYVLQEEYNPPGEGEVFEFPNDRAMENQYLLQLSYYLEEIAPFQTKLPPGD